ncbi:hypothetical protein C7B65_19430 [Phormidesmis priestleyi ULC007]|uniref:DUF4359 domain-containing protein n=1 Tax=Phormidesmis priestleyi ULC007 TaxID=1920490 RepID=A0A2T1D9K0_9CYAN|nr:hypothetical protein [Phormidesmis priestleyi]PSB17200.1 hypothetical protein C7B65_19430 [Phormidesmis priestleyi ULC007]PZO47983.1 MAG: hypothetical protein DCF14_18355 [Phormidesmis priestleyi]
MRIKLLLMGMLLSSFVAPAYAETKQLDYTLTSAANQSFSGLIEQAELLAERLAKQGFANPSTTVVEMRILAEREGLTAPILYVRVTRAEWQKQPKLRAITYLRGVDRLLGFSPQNSQPPVFPSATVSFASSQSEPNYYDNP